MLCAINVFFLLYVSYFFRGLSKSQPVLLTHGDSVDVVAKGFTAVAHSGKLVAGR